MSVTYQDVCTAHKRIGSHVHRTPIFASRIVNELVGTEIYFKCENLQKGGSFKVRGAMNAVQLMSRRELRQGVVTHSSGNHAAAVAIACRSRGAQAFAVMPRNAPMCKKQAVIGYGGHVIECESTLAARNDTASTLVAETGSTFLHPYDDNRIIAGQATTAKELLEDAPDLDVVMCPVGGGGLLAGTSISVKSVNPKITVVAGEPAGADDAKRSFESRQLVTNHEPKTIADGLLTTLGKRNFSIILELVDGIQAVQEESIVAAMRIVWQYMKLIIEPSSAVPLACLLEDKEAVSGKKVGIILSGGNVNLDNLPWRGSWEKRT